MHIFPKVLSVSDSYRTRSAIKKELVLEHKKLNQEYFELKVAFCIRDVEGEIKLHPWYYWPTLSCQPVVASNKPCLAWRVRLEQQTVYYCLGGTIEGPGGWLPVCPV